MSWSRVDAPWTSRLADRPLSQAAPPLTFHTPPLAWDYGALSEGAGEAVLHVRALLSTSGPYLYVHACEDIPSELRVRQLIEALSARSPHHRFHLLFVGFEDEDSDLSVLSDQVSKAYRSHPPAGAGANWEGDYEAWDKALAPFDLLLPSESPAANAEPSRRPGLISRLFARTGTRP